MAKKNKKKGDNVSAGKIADIDPATLKEIAATEPGPGSEAAERRLAEDKPTVPYGTPHYVWQAHGRWWYSDAEVRAHGPFDTQMQADIRMKLNHHNTAHGYAFQHVIDWDGRINPPMELGGITVTHIDHLRGLLGKGTASVLG